MNNGFNNKGQNSKIIVNCKKKYFKKEYIVNNPLLGN